jgi:hypothetical protein
MSTQLLVRVVVISLPAGGSTTISHGLKYNGSGVTPTQILCDRASSIGATAYNDFTATFTNLDGTAGASAVFRLEFDHSIHAVGAQTVAWQGFLASGGGGITAAELGTLPFTGTVDGAVVDGDPVTIKNGVMYRADAGNAARMPAVGVWQAAYSRYRNGGSMVVPGPIVANAQQYVAVGGGVTNVPVTGSGNTSQVIGQSGGGNTLTVALSQAITL